MVYVNDTLFYSPCEEWIDEHSQEQTDPCLCMSDKVIILVYVDDTLFYSPCEEWIDEVIQQIEQQDL